MTLQELLLESMMIMDIPDWDWCPDDILYSLHMP